MIDESLFCWNWLELTFGYIRKNLINTVLTINKCDNRRDSFNRHNILVYFTVWMTYRLQLVLNQPSQLEESTIFVLHKTMSLDVPRASDLVHSLRELARHSRRLDVRYKITPISLSPFARQLGRNELLVFPDPSPTGQLIVMEFERFTRKTNVPFGPTLWRDTLTLGPHTQFKLCPRSGSIVWPIEHQPASLNKSVDWTGVKRSRDSSASLRKG